MIANRLERLEKQVNFANIKIQLGGLVCLITICGINLAPESQRGDLAVALCAELVCTAWFIYKRIQLFPIQERLIKEISITPDLDQIDR